MMETGVLLGYLSLSALISILFKRYNTGTKEYFVAQGSFGILIIIPVMFAEVTAGAGTVGTAQVGYMVGFSAIWSKTAMALGYVICIFIINKYYFVANRKLNVVSVPAAFKVRFDERTRMIVMYITVLANLILFAIQPVALAGIISPLLGTPVFPTTMALGSIFILITLMGGMKGIAWANVIHAVMMYVGLLLIAVFSVKSTGWSNMRTVLPAEMFSLTELNPGKFAAWLISGVLSMVTSSALATIIFSAKSYRTSCIGISLSALLMVPFAFICAIIGMAARAEFGGTISGTQAIYMMASHMGPVFVLLSSVALVAAMISTAPTFLLFSVTSLTRDLYVPVINKNATDAQQMRFSRILAILLGGAAVILGSQATSILDQIMSALQIRTIPAVVLLLALVIPWINNNTAFWSILLSSAVSAVWFFLGSPFNIEPLWVGIAVLIPVLSLMVIISKKETAEGYKVYKKAFQEAKDEKLI